jgi:HK97 gp10 family phage protein
MADTMKLEVLGLQELEQKLREFGPRLAKNGLRAAVAAGARVVANEAKRNAPVDTGTLKRAVYLKQIREESNASQQTFFVGVRHGKGEKKKNRDGFYFPFVEFGTEKMAARPFVRPAFEATKEQAAEAIKAKLAERIAKLAGEK